MTPNDVPRRALSVSELTLRIRDRLEEGFPDLWVEGEVSNLRTPTSGHLYFTLKDSECQIRAVLFRGSAVRLRFDLRDGLQVLVRGRLTVYELRGEYQLVLEYVEPKGIGALQIRFEQLKEQLAREGLFDESRKRPLPLLPRRIGIVTSPTGAAIRDMLSVIGRRNPILGVLIYSVPVQGEEAAPKIAEGIRALNASGMVDVIIVGRGGGSWEDLWCFNEEIVVRAIAGSSVPVVSAVGHEIDVTLADFAADYRAPTPSGAAEAVAPDLEGLARTLLELWARQERALRARMTLARQRLLNLQGHLPLLHVRFLRRAQQLDEVVGRLTRTYAEALSGLRKRVEAKRQAMGVWSPLMRARGAMVLVQQLMKRAEVQVEASVSLRRQSVRSHMAMLDNLSPLAVLGRGYSILRRHPGEQILKRAVEVSVGDEIHARLSEGRLRCRIQEVGADTE